MKKKQLTLVAVVLLLAARPSGQSGSSVGNKRTIRVSTGETPIIIEPVYDKNDRLVDIRGAGFYFANWTASRYNYSIDVVKIYRNQGGQDFVGRYVNGSWTGVVGDLLRGDADLGLVVVGSRPYNAFVDPTFPLGEETFSIFIPYPTVGTNVWSFLQPFSKTTWILLLVSFVMVTVITWLLQNCNVSRGKGPSFGTTMLYFTSVITSQGGTWNHRGKAFTFISAAWCLSCIVLVNAYNGLLTSYLTVVTPKLLVSSIDELAAKPEVKFYTFNDSYISNYFKASKAGPEKILGDVFKEHPERILKSPNACMEQVEKGPFVCLSSTSIGEFWTKLKSKQTGGECTILRVQPAVLSLQGTSLMPKRSPLAKTINQGIIEVLSAGMQQKLLSDYSRGMGNRCNTNPSTKPNENQKRALSLVNLSGAFILLGIGYQLSLIVFILERLSFCKLLNTKLRQGH